MAAGVARQPTSKEMRQGVTDCLNLQELFGGRFVIRFDPARRRPGDKRDPWAMLLRSRFATIYPHGGHVLGVEVEGHPSIRGQLDSLDCCQRYLDGERFGCWLFHVRDFDRVAAVVRPARKRAWTGTERQRSAAQLKANINSRFVTRIDSRISSAVCELADRRASRAVQGRRTP